MTVFENLLVAAQQGGGLRRRASYAAAVGALERAGMSGQANVPAERLGLLQRKRLELARALATQPTLLLLDEVAGGLTDPEVAQLVEIVRGVNAEGIAVVWIEHVVRALTAVVRPPDLPVRRQVRRRRRTVRGAGRARGPRGLPRLRGQRGAGRRLAGSLARRIGRRRGGRGRERAVTEPGNGARPDSGTPLLEVRDLTVNHGQLRALDSISLRVFPGEVYAMIGANGAGKSTLLRTIAGLHRPAAGSVLLDGADLTRLRPERRARQGIVMVPEGRRLFGSLTVEENLKVGSHLRTEGPVDDRAGLRDVRLDAGSPQPAHRPAVRR